LKAIGFDISLELLAHSSKLLIPYYAYEALITLNNTTLDEKWSE
jgi:hypothetical protein